MLQFWTFENGIVVLVFTCTMRLTLLQNIFYEVVTETSDGKTFCQFFNDPSFLNSREAALNSFMESVLYDDPRPEEMFFTVYMRHLKTGERLELISTSSYEHPGETLKSLERELFFYQQENIATNVAIYNHDQPNKINILWPRFKNAHLLCNPSTSAILANNYWIFLKKKKEQYLIA
jgi:hypothetical protein